MSQKTPSPDSNFDSELEASLDAYRQAAEYDDFLFGDHDYSYLWKDEKPNDIF